MPARRVRSRRRFDLSHFQPRGAPPWTGIWPTAINHMQLHGRRDPWSVPFHCIHLVLRDGLRFYSRRGADSILRAGDTFLIEPGVPFAYHESGDELIHLYALRLEGRLIDAWIRALGFGPDRLHFAVREPAAARRVLQELHRLARRDDPAAAHDVVAALHRLPPLFGGGEIPAPTPDLAERVMRHLQQDLALGENVDQLARRFGVSRSTLFLHCRERFGLSPARLLIEARIHRAKLLLETTALQAGEIARLCGYHRPEHFHRQFREQAGTAPLDWRRRHAGD